MWARSATTAGATSTIRAARPSRRPSGTRSTTTFVESVPEADSERAIEQLARTGHDLIFTTSFGFMEPTLKVAKKYPNIKFEHATGFKRAPNLSTYAAKFHEGRYIIGQIAGKMTKSNTIGYVGAFPIPEVVVGHQLLLPRRAIGEPEREDQGRVGQFLV